MKAQACVLALLTLAAVPALGITDIDILNFALNLEYLEAQFYSFAVHGSGIPSSLLGGGPAPSGPSKKPKLDYAVDSIAAEIASDELKHVKFLRLALGKAAVKSPKIDVNGAFAVAADAALNTKLKPAFSPYSSSLTFLHGAFIFEDVGVTAYKGAANKISSKNYLQYAAGILAVEAYHAGTIRTLLYQKADTAVQPYGAKVSTIVEAISKLRAKLGGGADQGIEGKGGSANIVPTNGNSIAFGRTPAQVISIVTAGAKNHKGLFFPDGLNGAIH